MNYELNKIDERITMALESFDTIQCHMSPIDFQIRYAQWQKELREYSHGKKPLKFEMRAFNETLLLCEQMIENFTLSNC